MILVDLNLILYAIDADSPHHERAREWWDAQLSATAPVGLTWSVLLGFIRVSTHGRIMPNPLPLQDALGLVGRWLAQPCVQIVQPTERHWDLLQNLLLVAGTGSNLTMDAHLATLAIEHGCELYSTDADFSRFPKLRWKNPLTSKK